MDLITCSRVCPHGRSEGDACADLAPIRWRTVVVLGAGGASPPSLSLSAKSYRRSTYEHPTGLPIRVGLPGLVAEPGAITLAMLCRARISPIAARQIKQLSQRCKAFHPSQPIRPTVR